MSCYQKGTSKTNSNNSPHSENTQMNDSRELGEDDTGTIHKTNGEDTRTLGMSFSSYENVCNKCFNKYCILLFIIIIIAYFHVTTDKIAANIVIAMKNSGESKNYLKQVAQSLDQISNNMPDESHAEILQQMCDKMAEVLKAIE